MATKILMPKLSDTMTEGVILKWLRKEGDAIKQGEILAEIESDKADMELEAYDSGVVRKIFVPEGGKAAIGAPIAIIAKADEDISRLLGSEIAPAVEKKAIPAAPDLSAPPPPAPATVAPQDNRLKASPLARRIASENQINLAQVPGTGPQGRIIKRDLQPLLRPGASVQRIAVTPAAAGPDAEDIDLSPIRKTIAIRMAESKAAAPHFYVTVEVDMAPASDFREQLNRASGTKISFTDIILKACASALMKHPRVNATYLGDKMRVFHHAHIGVAVALESGLVTPVLRHCEQKGIGTINRELRDLAERARTRKLRPEEYQGATFTVSNLGMYGVEDFVAIINPPEGAILAVGSILEKPIVRNGSVVPGRTMRMTLSSDHRIIDGAVAAEFLRDLKLMLENPASLAL